MFDQFQKYTLPERTSPPTIERIDSITRRVLAIPIRIEQIITPTNSNLKFPLLLVFLFHLLPIPSSWIVEHICVFDEFQAYSNN